ncbi:TOMM precursor leader peptide-binding protein [Allocoleopsis franciscana]|uniref:Bacteriocin biosynthesis cyclodehydratase domain protein n=1 Tax=Allocoleopsis franciscana PCC 7113 TaxID=1173027 RepID=K9WBM2_9CYAN|nr:TOMM precursor leader peptide-binding protein [Allocoleopsis franciscana]AFZ16922.1 bacteriocin biosynthesis cyclodehydratase domain protein [Allocoleopsis franciscana PCC 7113]
MLNKPTLKRCFQYKIINSEDIFLISERGSLRLSGRLYRLLIPLLDGNHTVDEIVEQLKDKVSAPEVYYTLMLMEQKGYIVESDIPLPSNLAIFCDHLNIEPQKAFRRLQSTKVAVKTFGSNLPYSEFKTTLESLHIQVAEEGDLEIVLTDDYLQDGLETVNEKALHFSRPWMLVNPVGTIIWLGPIVVPGKTGCWQCLAQRLRDNRPVEEFIQRHANISTLFPPPIDSLPSTLQTALGMAATEVFKWILQGENQRLEGVLVTHDTLTLESQNHSLVKRPQCPSCGEIANGLKRKPLPIILGHRKKTFTADGGHRFISPEETLRKYQHHLSPITGVVRELSKVFTGSNDLTHTYVAKHHFATMFDDVDTLRRNILGRSAGKGKTNEQARASAFCEAIERYSGTFQGDEFRQKSSYQKLGDKAIHPNACLNFSQAQYENRASWNANCFGWFQKVPEPFDQEQEIDWTPIWSLTHKDFKYLPTAYCYYGYPKPPKIDCWADSNGCAAGNTIEEAILQGFMELVERDCVALWWYNQVKRPKVDLDSFDEPYFQSLKDYYQTLNRELWVLDITSDLNIPAFAAISRRTDRKVEDIILGYGAHFDPQLAIQRSLTEINQILPSVLSANADGSTQYTPSADPLALDWWKTATLENQPYLVPDESVVPKVSADYPQLWSDDLREDVLLCNQIAEKHGMELLVLDQTRPDIGLKVVKVIVPGMRHFWKRLGSGRLYEVPVQLGWLKEPLQENQLNLFPMWM